MCSWFTHKLKKIQNNTKHNKQIETRYATLFLHLSSKILRYYIQHITSVTNKKLTKKTLCTQKLVFKTPISNICMRMLLTVWNVWNSKYKCLNECMFVYSLQRPSEFVFCWYECHSNYSIGSWHKFLALTPTTIESGGLICVQFKYIAVWRFI